MYQMFRFPKYQARARIPGAPQTTELWDKASCEKERFDPNQKSPANARGESAEEGAAERAKLWTVRSRWWWRGVVTLKHHFQALAEIYKIHITIP